MLPRRTLILSAAAGVTLFAGCKWLNGDRDRGGPIPDGSTGRNSDPLLGRISPQNVPTGRDRDGLAGGRRDPILSTPAGRSGGGVADDLPPRTANNPGKPPFRNSLSTTPAALAGGSAPDADLTIDRGPAKPDPGPVPLTPAGGGESFDTVAAKLRAHGATVAAPARGADGYTVAVTVPLGGDPPGTRRYTGTGPTAAAAAEHALRQVAADGK